MTAESAEPMPEHAAPLEPAGRAVAGRGIALSGPPAGALPAELVRHLEERIGERILDSLAPDEKEEWEGLDPAADAAVADFVRKHAAHFDAIVGEELEGLAVMRAVVVHHQPGRPV